MKNKAKPNFQSQKYFSQCQSPNRSSLAAPNDIKKSFKQFSPSKKSSIQLFTTVITLKLANSTYQIPCSSQDTVQTLLKKLFEILQPLNPQLVKEIVGFTTITNNFALDYYLTQFNQHISLFHNITIQPLFSSSPKFNQVGLQDFIFLYPIGSGGFSVVYLCRKRDSGQFYALKIIDKQLIIESGKKYLIQNESDILKKLDHPFITKLYYCFESKHFVVFALEFCAGGDLFYHLSKMDKFSEYQAAFYMAELIIGLEYIHSKNIIYRDFKPENILFDLDGHVKIADFGLGKCSQRSHSFCGSPEYMAPEMLQKNGHGQSLDYYNLGAVLYEMLNGVPPFYNKDQEQMYDDILNKELKFNKGISQQAQDLIKKLMDKNAKKRLQKNVLDHVFFKPIDIKKLKEGTLQSPLKINSLILNFSHSDSRKAESILKNKLREVDVNDKFEQLFEDDFYFEDNANEVQINDIVK